jgi:hypothetical protein
MSDSVPLPVIIAAWRRGWTQDQIAFAAGVSHQAISLRIVRYEKQNGPVSRIKRSYPNTAVKIPWNCANCGVLEWSPHIRLAQWEQHFCSCHCMAEYTRVVTDQTVEKAIRLREEDNGWKDIANILGFPVQTIQMRIWKHLYLTGRLNRGVVESIWVKTGTNNRPPAWNWLEANTGIYCHEDGPLIARRNYRPGASAWGQRLKAQQPPGPVF